MDYVILTANSPEQLLPKVKNLLAEKWKPVGGHGVVETRRINRYSGTQHMDTVIQHEYSQTMVRLSDEQ